MGQNIGKGEGYTPGADDLADFLSLFEQNAPFIQMLIMLEKKVMEISKLSDKQQLSKFMEIFTILKNSFLSMISLVKSITKDDESNLYIPSSSLPVEIYAGSTKRENIYKDTISIDLHIRKDNHEKKELKETSCSKYRDHDKFIDLAHFEKDQTYLPDKYRQPIMKDLIKSLADLIVKIEVKHSSKTRLQDFLHLKVSDILEGTGKVDDVFLYGQDDDDVYCQCDECKDVKSPKKEWGEIRILTSGKLIISEKDIKNTQCLLFYDEENTSNIDIIKGDRIVMLDKEKDICKFICISHNMDLIRKLDKMADAFVENWKKAFKQLKTIKSCEDKLVIIVSHPHGCKKHISFGQWEKQYNADDILKGYKYNTPTCPGCTGSFLLMPNFDDPEDINIP